MRTAHGINALGKLPHEELRANATQRLSRPRRTQHTPACDSAKGQEKRRVRPTSSPKDCHLRGKAEEEGGCTGEQMGNTNCLPSHGKEKTNPVRQETLRTDLPPFCFPPQVRTRNEPWDAAAPRMELHCRFQKMPKSEGVHVNASHR